MNIETNGTDINAPGALDERITSMVSTLLTVADPRLIVNALLSNAAELATLILKANRATHAQVAQAFSTAMVEALTPAQEAKEEKLIQVVPAGVVPIKR